MERDERIKVLVTDIADLGHASNLGIDNTAGAYISFVDVDDWVDPEYISKLYAGIEKGYRICKANCISMMAKRMSPHTKVRAREKYPLEVRCGFCRVERFQCMIEPFLKRYVT